MAEKERRALADSDTETWSRKHSQIVKDEIAAINTRRDESRKLSEPQPDKMIDAAGLAFSGGGIRSAAVCLGVLQALNHHGLLPRIDYLSTVSGGGYIGSSFTATMTYAKEFVFGARLTGGNAGKASEISDTPAVGHIRNYSNYLIPAGARDLLTGIAIVVRGLVANLAITLPIVLILAAVTIWSTPLRTCLEVPNLFGVDVASGAPGKCALHQYWLFDHYGFIAVGALLALALLLASGLIYLAFRRTIGKSLSVFVAYGAGVAFVMGLICAFASMLPVNHFALTLAAALLGLALFFLWALRQSWVPADRQQEFRGHLPTMGATYLVLLGLIGFFEFQPFVISEMFDTADSGAAYGAFFGLTINWIKSLAALATPIAAVVTIFRQQVAEFLKGSSVSSELSSIVMGVVAKAAIWVAGAALLLLIWIAYLYLSYWGIGNDANGQVAQCNPPPSAVAQSTASKVDGVAGKIQFDSKTSTLSAEITAKPGSAPPSTDKPTLTSHAPGWLVSMAKRLGDCGAWEKAATVNDYGRSMAISYAVVAGLLLLLSLFLKPNANSLHRLYRDRLSKAFLFDPKHYADGEVARNEPSLDQGRDFAPLDDEKLSNLCPPIHGPNEAAAAAPATGRPRPDRLEAPYHLINTALNIQGSDFANRRGRNADFFLLSPLYVGSEATHYAETPSFEAFVPSFDLATAVAISGAAASSNMGSASIKPLTPTLALLNVRLGYWLKNPRYLRDWQQGRRRHASMLYLWSEISGRLYENSNAVYLTDGGHIENLGIYELLRRRCKLIIAVDAEADAAMHLPALVTLERYARIDLGIRINLPWQAIQQQTLAWMKDNAGKTPADKPPPAATDGPHVAIGTIDYGGDDIGYLVYIKSSLTGDENDYIRDYARRYDRFPHETTGDQFFSEEQFEVYRALGFHMTHEFLDGRDKVAVMVGDRPEKALFMDPDVAVFREVREALGLPVGTPDRSG